MDCFTENVKFELKFLLFKDGNSSVRRLFVSQNSTNSSAPSRKKGYSYCGVEVLYLRCFYLKLDFKGTFYACIFDVQFARLGILVQERSCVRPVLEFDLMCVYTVLMSLFDMRCSLDQCLYIGF